MQLELNSYDSTKNSLLDTQTELRDEHIEHLKVGESDLTGEDGREKSRDSSLELTAGLKRG